MHGNHMKRGDCSSCWPPHSLLPPRPAVPHPFSPAMSLRAGSSCLHHLSTTPSHTGGENCTTIHSPHHIILERGIAPQLIHSPRQVIVGKEMALKWILPWLPLIGSPSQCHRLPSFPCLTTLYRERFLGI